MTEIRHDWTLAEIQALFDQPFNDLMFQAQLVHRQNFDANQVQISQLLSIKTGACPEDCKYCPQSNRYDTGLEKEKLMEIDLVVNEARKAKESGATRFCMGAAWRSPKKKDMPYVTAMVRGVKELGLETCMTLGMLTDTQAGELNEAGLDYYNHNLDTSEEYYEDIITTRTYGDRLSTLANVRGAGIKVCSGGIVGMGEEAKDRCGLLRSLANLPRHPESVPINMLVQVEGTPLADLGEIEPLDPFDFIRTIAVARIMMPKSAVRLSAGREDMSDEMQAMTFMAGANSIFYGEKLLTCKNPSENHDHQLFDRLGINSDKSATRHTEEDVAAGLTQKINELAMDKVFYDASAS